MTTGNSKFHNLFANIDNGRIAELSLKGRTATCRTPALTLPNSSDGHWFSVGDKVTIGSDGSFQHA